MNYDISIIIACYNEEDLLEKSVVDLINVMDQTRYKYELIFVDDCSRDKTREIILKIVGGNENMRHIFHEKNIGRGGTVSDGIKVAKGDIVGFLDIDLEVHARYITSMILAINHGYDIATAHRIYKLHFSPSFILRHILSLGYRKLMKLSLSIPIEDTETGFKFFKKNKIMPILDLAKNKGWFWDTEIMALSYLKGLKIKEIPCLFIRRADKVSSVNVIRDTIDYMVELYKFKKRKGNIQN